MFDQKKSTPVINKTNTGNRSNDEFQQMIAEAIDEVVAEVKAKEKAGKK